MNYSCFIRYFSLESEEESGDNEDDLDDNFQPSDTAASSESEDDANECFLNFKSRKLALMRKSGASDSLDQSEARKLSRDSCRPIRVEYSSDLESSNLIASPNSSGGFFDKRHLIVDAQER